MTKALVTIEVDFDTSGIVELKDSGAGESSNPNHPGQRHITEGKRNHIWDSVAKLIETNPEMKSVVKVRLVRKENE
jgi:hypothetical protein